MTTSFHVEDVDVLHLRMSRTRTGSDSSRTFNEAHWHDCCTTDARVRAPLPDSTAWLCETRTAAPTQRSLRPMAFTPDQQPCPSHSLPTTPAHDQARTSFRP